MLVKVLASVAFTLLFSGAMAFFARYTDRAPIMAADGVTLRHGRALFGLGGLGLAFASFILVVGLSTLRPEEPVSELVAILSLGVGFGFMGAYLVMVGAFEVVRIGPEWIETRTWFGRWRSLGWDEIEQIRFNALSGYLKLTGREGERLRVSALLAGSDDLVASLEGRLQSDGASEAADTFRQYRAAYGGSAKR